MSGVLRCEQGVRHCRFRHVRIVLAKMRIKQCGRSSMVEFQPSKLAVWVRFPSPALCVLGSLIVEIAAVAQLVEYVLGKDGVVGSSPTSSFSA